MKGSIIFTAFMFFALFSVSQDFTQVYIEADHELIKYFWNFPGQIDYTVSDNKIIFPLNESQFYYLINITKNFKVIPDPENINVNLQMADSVFEMENWDKYPAYELYVEMMYNFETEYPELCSVESIGKSIQNREILVAKISDNAELDETEPEFFYSAQMHGDELITSILMLRLIDYLLKNYQTDSFIKMLVDNIEIWINPLSNPDGLYYGGNDNVSGAIRFNSDFVDLNRNFPDIENENPDGNERQPENIVMIDFMSDHNFIMSANLHSGTEVVNYPWDTKPERHVDDRWFQYVSGIYAENAINNEINYFTEFSNGFTNGYDWYTVDGSRQDYVTYFLHGREVTLELCNDKIVDSDSLPKYWELNKISLLKYMEQALFSINGFVHDDENMPVEAMITVTGHDNESDSSFVFSCQETGEFYRLIQPGEYNLLIYADRFFPAFVYDISINHFESVNLDIELNKYNNDQGSLTVFPNPFDDQINLFFDIEKSSVFDIFIINVAGEIVFKDLKYFESGSNVHTLSFDTELAKGVYYIWLTSANYQFIRKLVKM